MNAASAATNPAQLTGLPRKRPTSLTQAVTDDLMAKIRSGRYKPGDKLPAEPEIIAEQGVSRTVVREAISRLQAAGLAETRHGVGTFVLAPVTQPLDGLTVVTLRDALAMMEMRISLETEAAGYAALRRSDGQLAQMRSILERYGQDIDDGDSATGSDFEFHLLVAQATGNPYFEDFYRHLGLTTIPRNRLDTAPLAGETNADYLRRVGREHEAILEAIERRDPEMARAAMRIHLTNSRERLRRAGGDSA